jgi:hypothetical protein
LQRRRARVEGQSGLVWVLEAFPVSLQCWERSARLTTL